MYVCVEVRRCVFVCMCVSRYVGACLCVGVYSARSVIYDHILLTFTCEVTSWHILETIFYQLWHILTCQCWS